MVWLSTVQYRWVWALLCSVMFGIVKVKHGALLSGFGQVEWYGVR